MVEKVRLGLIGTGRIGRMHARNLKYRIPGAELAAVSDIMEEAACSVAKELAIPVVEADYRKLLERDDIDGVVICSPTIKPSPMLKVRLISCSSILPSFCR
jgi:myo-inositol 2-dehydrogenase/D-chiro-inositol 1-dehydrogenase